VDVGISLTISPRTVVLKTVASQKHSGATEASYCHVVNQFLFDKSSMAITVEPTHDGYDAV
jgi:hypothetical protein